MSGVGSIEKDCRTLYVGNINCRRPQTEQELWEEFGEWGEVEVLMLSIGFYIMCIWFQSNIVFMYLCIMIVCVPLLW